MTNDIRAMAPETGICIARHGETDWNVTGILQGWTDVPLNDRGRAQSREMAERCSARGFSAVCTSPLRRSLETAEIVAAAWALPAPAVYPGIKERHFGRVQGMPKTELAVSHPGLHREILRRNPACDFEGGEPMDPFADRVLRAVHRIAADFAGQRVLVITHGWVMDVVTRQLWGLPRSAVLDLKRRNGEAIWLRATPGGELREDPRDRDDHDPGGRVDAR